MNTRNDNCAAGGTPRVLVHLHCFYPGEVCRLLRRLGRVREVASLRVVATVPRGAGGAGRMADEVRSRFPDAKILPVDNLGYDAGPFVEVLGSESLSDYDFVLKLHTMRRSGGSPDGPGGIGRDAWADMLAGSLLSSPARFSEALRVAGSDGVGMVGSGRCVVSGEGDDDRYYLQRAVDELEGMGLAVTGELRYVAGSMFLARARLLAPLSRYKIGDFGRSLPTVHGHTLAHVLERLYGGLVLAQGYEVRGLGSPAAEARSRVGSGTGAREGRKKKGRGLSSLPKRVRRKYDFEFRAYEMVARSDYFDAAWYRASYPEIGDADPVTDYLGRGWREGRNPSRYFDNERYIARYPDCKERGCNPLLHYECYGRHGKKGIGTPGIQALAKLATIRGSALFDADWYLRNNPDVKNKGIDPAEHYLLHGGTNGRDPSPLFCSGEYLALHPDVRRAGMNPLYHYMTDGFIQGHALSTLEQRPPSFPEGAVPCSRAFSVRPAEHRRTAVVATYSADGTVAETLLYLLRGLSEVVDNVVLVGDSPLFPGELGRLDGLVAYAEYERRGQYDFGSYKRGLALARELRLLGEGDVDELVIMNDSCYGPVYPLGESFDYMRDNVRYDFWGYFSNKNAGEWHLCSNFYCFNRRVIDSKLLDEFFCRVRGELTRGVAIEQFEIPLSQTLLAEGMVGRSLVGWSAATRYNHRNIRIGLTRYRLPLIKKKSVSGEAADNIFAALEIVRRDNPELYDLMDKRLRTYEHRLPTLSDHLEALPATVGRVRGKVIGGEAARVLFLVNDAAMFPGRPLFDAMLRDADFDPWVVVIPDTRYPDSVEGDMARCERGLLEAGVARDRLRVVARDRYDRWPDVTGGADIVCYPSPYNVSSYNYNVRYAMGRDFLPIIFNYGYYRSLYDREVMGLYNYAYYWKVFVECEENLAEYREYSELRGANASLVGYAKMDRLAEVERREHKRPRVLVALHHSVDGGYNPKLSLANFVRYSDYFFGLPDRYPQVDFVYRPHPALLRALGRFSGWDEDRVADYEAGMRAKPNVIWSDGGDYFQEFADSDACIQDCGSFLVEYVYTGKPCCYMLKDPSDIEAKFAPLGKACLEQCYVSYSTKDIDDFIKDVVLGGDDPKAGGRAELARRVMLNYPHAAEAALEDIRRSILGDEA